MSKKAKQRGAGRGGGAPGGRTSGLIPGDRLHPALEADLRGDEPDDDRERDSDAGDGDTARVVVALLADLGAYVPDRLRVHGERPVWFLPEDDADDVDLFELHPEAPMPRATSDAILAALRAFVADKSDALQAIVGSTDSIELGFHTSASFEDVAASFDADGFELVIGAITAGQVLGEDGAA